MIADDPLPSMVKNYLSKIKDNLKHVDTSKKRSPNSEFRFLIALCLISDYTMINCQQCENI